MAGGWSKIDTHQWPDHDQFKLSTETYNISAEPSDINKWEVEGIHNKLKLTSVINLSNMVLHDKDGVLKKYESAKEIMEEFYHAR